MTLRIRHILVWSIAIILPLAASSGFSRVYDDGSQPQPRLVKGTLVVQFEETVNSSRLSKAFGKISFDVPSLDRILDQYGVTQAEKVFPWRTEKPAVNSGLADLSRYYQIKFSHDVDLNQLKNELLQNPNVRSVDEVWEMPLEATPNDAAWSKQWAMSPPTPDPNFYLAWNTENGSDSIKIAIIDSGVNYRHRDLAPNVWVNPGEDVDGDLVVYDPDDLNGIDDDGNGVIDDLIGYDFFTGLDGGVYPGEDGGTPDPDPNDFDGHGTHVAGITAAAVNNAYDVTGVAGGWFGGNRAYRGARIMCLRAGATGADGLGYVNSINCATAIDYAVMMGANVINASWGGSSWLASALNNALASGLTFCHAAGNSNDDTPDYLDLQVGVISVASTNNADVKSSFSNYGEWVDVSAPGSSILSTVSIAYAPDTATFNGTSMASPMVAGLAALIRSAVPSLTKAQVDSIIINTADYDALYNANPLWAGLLGSGRIDAYQALADLPSARFTSDVSSGNVPLHVQFADMSPNSPVAWDWSLGTGDVSTDQNPHYVYNNPGIYSVSLLVDENNPLGLGEEHLRNYIWARADTVIFDSVKAPRGTRVEVPVYLANTSQIKEIQLAFSYANSLGVTYDGYSVEGTRAEYFESVDLNGYDGFNKRIALLMKTNTSGGSTYLLPDTGAIINLYFQVSPTALDGVVTLDTITAVGKIPRMTSIWGDFWPIDVKGKIVIGGCCIDPRRGNIDGVGTYPFEIDIADLVYLVNYMFNGGTAPACRDEANVDGIGVDPNDIDIADLVYLVNFMFSGGAEPVACD